MAGIHSEISPSALDRELKSIPDRIAARPPSAFWRGLYTFRYWLKRRRAARARSRHERVSEIPSAGLPFFLAHNPYCMSNQVLWMTGDRSRSDADADKRDLGA
jgi:hypothetical protein